MRSKGFLAQVLPTDGCKCWVRITKRKRVTQGFVTSIEELAAKLSEIDAEGADAYFACSAYRTPDNRRAENVLGAKAFWMDIDLWALVNGEKVQVYADADEAIYACDEFCDRAGLPRPGIVESGGGIHAYWCLDNVLDAGTWLAVAQRLKLLASVHGLHADPSRTADPSSILRIPESRNFKLSEPRPVKIHSSEGFELLETVKFIEQVLQAPVAASHAPACQLAHPSAPGGSLGPPTAPSANSALLAGISSKAFDFTKGLKEGGRNNALARAFGELLAKGYSEEIAIRQCWQWNQLNEPPLDTREFAATVKSILHAEQRKRQRAAAPMQAADPEPNELQVPPPYFQTGTQICVEIEDDAGTLRKKPVLPFPGGLVAITNHEHADGEKKLNGYLFKLWDEDKREWHYFTLTAEQWDGTHWYRYWRENGGTVMPGMDKTFKNYIRSQEVMFAGKPNKTLYSQCGWKENDTAFLVGTVLFKNGASTRVHASPKLASLADTLRLGEGSLDEWKAQADKLFSPGLEAQGFSLLASLGAPLVKFTLAESEGGCILSLISSNKSGAGKTPTIEAIASVWGELGCVRITGGFTENRMTEHLVRAGNLPVAREELVYGDPAAAAEMVKRFTTGTDRMRLHRDGSSSGMPEYYQTILLCSANVSLRELTALVDPAASRRIFELDISAPDSAYFSHLGGITGEMLRCRGHAGREYARLLTVPGTLDYIKEHLKGRPDCPGSTVLRYRRELDTVAQDRYIISYISACDVGARIATHYGLLTFDVDRIMRWGMQQARTWVGKVNEVTPSEEGLTAFMRFLSEHQDGVVVVDREWRANAPVIEHRRATRKLVMRLETVNKMLYVDAGAFKRWCIQNRIPYSRTVDALKSQAIIAAESRRLCLGAGTSNPSTQIACLAVNMNHAQMAGSESAEILQLPKQA